MSQVWDVRAAKPCLTVHRSPASPPSCLSWSGDDMLVVGDRAGSLLTLDPRAPGAPLSTGQFLDREVRRLRWDGEGKRLAVAGDDNVVKVGVPCLALSLHRDWHCDLEMLGVDGDLHVQVVEVRSGRVVEVYQDRRHQDYVRGLAWCGEHLWWGSLLLLLLLSYYFSYSPTSGPQAGTPRCYVTPWSECLRPGALPPPGCTTAPPPRGHPH